MAHDFPADCDVIVRHRPAFAERVAVWMVIAAGRAVAAFSLQRVAEESAIERASNERCAAWLFLDNRPPHRLFP